MDYSSASAYMLYSEHISIPDPLPDILKQYAKAAIRSQPKDLLKWSYLYFKALSENKDPAQKANLSKDEEPELTPEVLLDLYSLVNHKTYIERSELVGHWIKYSLPLQTLSDILALGKFGNNIPVIHFLSLSVAFINKDIRSALHLLTLILNKNLQLPPESLAIPFQTFAESYTFLAKLDANISQQLIDEFMSYLMEETIDTNGQVYWSMLETPKCPPMQVVVHQDSKASFFTINDTSQM